MYMRSIAGGVADEITGVEGSLEGIDGGVTGGVAGGKLRRYFGRVAQ